MTETVITVVGKGLDAAVEKKLLQQVKATGVDGLRTEILNPEYAIDILVNVYNDDLLKLLRTTLSSFISFDVFVQKNDVSRRKKVLISDMDATMIQHETLDELAAHFGLKDKIAPITEKAMRGEIDFAEALQMRVRLLKGLAEEALYETIKGIHYSPGGQALVRTMSRHGARCVLVSGGFEMFTGHVAATLGFHSHFGNRLVIEGHKLTGEVIPPILDKTAKEKMVVDQARACGCGIEQVMAIGDGANDVPMLKKAGVGIGYFGKPAVQQATPHQIRYTDLVSALYMQGYAHDMISA